jgi:hypothetical protein
VALCAESEQLDKRSDISRGRLITKVDDQELESDCTADMEWHFSPDVDACTPQACLSK